MEQANKYTKKNQTKQKVRKTVDEFITKLDFFPILLGM